MKNKSLLMALPLFSVLLTSCGQVKKYDEHLEDYVYTMAYHPNFNVLQLTDIHWNANTSTKSSEVYLEKTLKEADKHIKERIDANGKIDLVEITGDAFMLANAFHVNEFIRFFEKKAAEYGFKYTVIWGNHDRHGLYNPNWLADSFKKAKNCIYIEENDNLYGRSNFVINLTVDGTATTATKWQLANLDSGASFSESAMSPFRDYDYIRKDQTEWFVKEKERIGVDVPVIAYYHIPQMDNEKLFKEVEANPASHKNKFFKLEGFGDNGNEKYASNFIEVATNYGLKAAFMGHAHNVDWTVETDDHVVIGLGVKTTTELYFAHIDVNSTDPMMQKGLASLDDVYPAPITENFDLVGAALVTITGDDTFDLEHLYLNERKSGDFVRWVKW